MTVNVGSIKTNFKSILDTANTTTAAFDLSTGLSRRVQKVLKVNPSLIMPQASFFPWVTITPDRKTVLWDKGTIAVSQLNGKRFAQMNFSVVAAVYEQIFSDVTVDPADEQIEKIMENIEELQRRNFKLNNTVTWSKTEEVSYHSLPIGEQTHMRIGVLTLACLVDY